MLVEHRDLGASTGTPEPHDFAVRKERARLAHSPRPSHPASTYRDDAYAPSSMRRDGIENINFRKKETEIFSLHDRSAANRLKVPRK